MYDYFVAALRCPNCNTVSAADSSTNMQTHIRDDAAGSEIAVGFRLEPLEIRDQDIVSSGYLATGQASTDDHIRLLETWQCPTCGAENSACVTLSDTEVVAIEPVILDRAMLQRAQYISDNCCYTVETKTATDTIVLAAERELRVTGSLSDQTCRAFGAIEGAARRGFEASFGFLECPSNPSCRGEGPVPAPQRLAAIRLMLLRLGAHTSTPRWSSHVLENLIDAALRPPGATVGDVVHALFVLLAEAPPGLAKIQANFIREIGVHVVGIQRSRYAGEDFSWLASAISDSSTKPNAAQAYLVAYTLPPSFTPQCLDAILQALHSTPFEEEVKRELGE